jgi:Tfp pilus assembly protein PilN
MSQQINLLNPQFLRQQKYFSAVAMLQSLALLMSGTGLVVGFLIFEQGRLDREVKETARLHKVQEERFKKLSFELSPDRANQELNASLKSAEEQIATRRVLLDRLGADVSAGSTGYSALLHALSRQHVDGVWLTGVRVDSGSQQITVKGRARSADLIAPYMERLGTEPILKGKAFRKLEVTGESAGAVAASIEFVLTTVETRPDPARAGSYADGAQKVQP